MFGNYRGPVHVYHHFESPPCKSCGYRSNTGYFDKESFYYHLMHTINESSVLIDRIVKDKKVKVAKK